MPVTDGRHFPANSQKFEFDAEVTEIFDSMALRAIPGYVEAHEWIKHILCACQYEPFSQVWDFGCSTGAAIKQAMLALNDPRLDYIGADISKPMIDKAAERNRHARFIQHDLNSGLPRSLLHGKVAVGIFAWTLQFLPDMSQRAQLLADVYDALLPEGKLFVFEKFQFLDPAMQTAADRAYYWWRRSQGYGFDEIHAKSIALQNSMFPWQFEALESLIHEFPGATLEWVYRHYQFGGVVVTRGAEK